MPPTAPYIGIGEILFASDLDQHDMESLHYLLSWALAFGANLQVLHITENDNSQERAGKKMNLMKRFFEDKVPANLISYKILEGKTAEKINEYATTIDADVLVMSTHIKKYWEQLLAYSTTRDIARTIDIPILVLKEEG